MLAEDDVAVDAAYDDRCGVVRSGVVRTGVVCDGRDSGVGAAGRQGPWW